MIKIIQSIILTLVVTLFDLCYAVDMPPLPSARVPLYQQRFKLEWLPDGYPGKRISSQKVVAHPIYGPYVIVDYLDEYSRTRNQLFLKGAMMVADSGLSRMQRQGSALVFLYHPEEGLIAWPSSHYSGLTQARWLDALTKLGITSGQKKYLDAAELVFNSLTIPTAESGVIKNVAGGVAIEEMPNEIPTYILNGWTTALLFIHDYAKTAENKAAQQLFDQNIVALEKLVPIYDLPEIGNTRYRLTGYTDIRFVSKHGLRIKSAQIQIPGEGAFPVTADVAKRNRWVNHFLSGQEGKIVQLNSVLCMSSYPSPNELHAEVEAYRSSQLKVQIKSVVYDPLKTFKARGWIDLAVLPLKSGPNSINIEIPWDKARLVAYPTNFLKKFNKQYFNSYHFIHIDNLRALYKITGKEVFRQYANKWEQYTKQWPSMDIYNKSGIVLERRQSVSR